MLSKTEPPHPAGQNAGQEPEPDLLPESDLGDLKLIMSQSIDRLAQQCQNQLQASLEQIWIAAEKERASWAQRIVSDHLTIVGEGTKGLPSYHPLHWFQAQLEFQLRGILEFSNQQNAQRSTQEILDRLQTEILTAIGTHQAAISEEFDRQIQNIRKSLATELQPQLPDQKVIITEYVNSYITLPQLQLRAVDKFGFFRDGQRVNVQNILAATTTTVSPWYLRGLQKKQQSSYQLTQQTLQLLLQESLTRTFADIQAQITTYLETDLTPQVHQLLASV